jgi:hypothetical protein
MFDRHLRRLDDNPVVIHLQGLLRERAMAERPSNDDLTFYYTSEDCVQVAAEEEEWQLDHYDLRVNPYALAGRMEILADWADTHWPGLSSKERSDLLSLAKDSGVDIETILYALDTRIGQALGRLPIPQGCLYEDFDD